MKKKRQSLVLVLLLIGLLLISSACDTCNHRDANDDNLCDNCKEEYRDGKDLDNSPAFVLSNVKATPGSKNVAVQVAIHNNPGISSIVLSLSYNNEHLKLTEVKYNSTVGGMTILPPEYSSPVTLYWINAFEDVVGDWTFATLYFDIDDNARGEYDLQLSYSANNVYNLAEENIDFAIENGKIVIE